MRTTMLGGALIAAAGAAVALAVPRRTKPWQTANTTASNRPFLTE
ncbi:hypothetical protein [Nonomuraea jabiensis]